MAVPQIGRGKNDGPNGRGDIGRSDISRFLSDQYKFRTPTLLNVEVTGPWGHSGAYTSLEAMVRHMANPARALAAYDEGQLGDQIPPVQLAYRDENSALALARLEANRAAGRTHFQPVDLTDQEVGQIVAFLKTLTDPCVKDRECLKPWFFEAQTVGKEDVDGLMLRAIDHRRSPL